METRSSDDTSSQTPSHPNGPWTRSQPSSSKSVAGENRRALPTNLTSTPAHKSATFLERISLLPELRDLPWRPNQSLPPDRSTESSRVQQRGACMVATRGRIVQNPCTHCAQGFGRFSSCIVLDNWFHGACATCIFTSKGNKCSLRIQSLGDQDARALRYMFDPDRKRKRSSIKFEEELANFGSFAQYVSPYPALPIIPRPPMRISREDPTEDVDMDSMLQAQIAREEADQGHMDEDQATKNAQRYQNSQAAAPIVMSRPRYYPPNRPRLPIQPLHNVPNTNAAKEPASTIGHHTAEEPVIDTYPKTTQRQIFALMSGLQGGIKNLQKELNSLKGIIGLEDEDEVKPGATVDHQKTVFSG